MESIFKNLEVGEAARDSEDACESAHLPIRGVIFKRKEIVLEALKALDLLSEKCSSPSNFEKLCRECFQIRAYRAK